MEFKLKNKPVLNLLSGWVTIPPLSRCWFVYYAYEQVWCECRDICPQGLSRVPLDPSHPPPTLFSPFPVFHPPATKSLFQMVLSILLLQGRKVLPSSKNRSHPPPHVGQQPRTFDTVQTSRYGEAPSDALVPWCYCPLTP